MNKILKALLLPPVAVVAVLTPISLGGMLWSMLRFGDAHPVTVAFYAMAFYSLVILCVRIPRAVRSFRSFKRENRYVRRWLGDARLRIAVGLLGSVAWNGAYAIFQLALGIYHHTVRFYVLAAYYTVLAVIRLFLLTYTARNEPGADTRGELYRYRASAWMLLPLNLVLSFMMLFNVRDCIGIKHGEITVIALAAYTFVSATMAAVNIIRYRRFNSPVFSASKAISLASACVSMLSLENTMLSTFGDGDMTPHTQLVFLSVSGGAVYAFIIAMAVYMLICSGRALKDCDAV